MGKSKLIAILWIAVAVMLAVSLSGGGCSSRTPLESLQKDLSSYPEYAIILEDMRIDGNFFEDYFHRYKVTYGERNGSGDTLSYQSQITDWNEVEEKEYRKYEDFLGMVLVSKSLDGDISETAYPSGYQYVGDSRYGTWRTDNSGRSFWEFYGQYAFLSAMFGGLNRPIYQDDWGDYRSRRRNGQPYFGPNREYGTEGKVTKQTNKSFFQRRIAREQRQKSAFSQKVKERVRRSRMSGVRSRSRGFGK